MHLREHARGVLNASVGQVRVAEDADGTDTVFHERSAAGTAANQFVHGCPVLNDQKFPGGNSFSGRGQHTGLEDLAQIFARDRFVRKGADTAAGTKQIHDIHGISLLPKWVHRHHNTGKSEREEKTKKRLTNLRE